jgi:uncharacterized membrane protein
MPTLVATLLGFIWITGAWLLSHRQLRQLRVVDHYLTLLSIATALTYCLIPVATQMLAEGYGHDDFYVGVEAVSLVVFAGTALAFGATRYAHRHGLLLETNTDDTTRRWALWIWWVVTVMVIVACVIAPVAPWVAVVLVVITRISAVLPLGSDREGYLRSDPETPTGAGATPPRSPSSRDNSAR